MVPLMVAAQKQLSATKMRETLVLMRELTAEAMSSLAGHSFPSDDHCGSSNLPGLGAPFAAQLLQESSPE
jgi:hypothetical protein